MSQLKLVSQAGSQMTPLSKNLDSAAAMSAFKRPPHVALPFVYILGGLEKEGYVVV